MAEPPSQLPTLTLARALAQTALQTPGVAALSPGLHAEVATYGRGERVRGVHVRLDQEQIYVDLHLAVEYDPRRSLPQLAAELRAQLGARLRELGYAAPAIIDLSIDDLY
jgi:uncharacterized alkaline shock family protein YloU